MRLLYIFCIFCFAGISVFAQDSLYTKVFDHTTKNIEPRLSVALPGESVAIVGDYHYGNAGFVLCLDSLSDERWSVNVTSGSGQNFFSGATATYDGGLATMGYMDDAAVCVRFDDQGDTLWTRAFAFNGWSSELATRVFERKDSTLLCAWSNSQVPSICLAQLSAAGTLMWSKVFSVPSMTEPAAFEEDTDGNIYLGLAGNMEGALVKLSSGGSVLWAKDFFGGEVFDLELMDSTVFIVSSKFGNYTTLTSADTSGLVNWSEGIYAYNDLTWMPSNLLFVAEDSTLILANPSRSGICGIHRFDLNGTILNSVSLEMSGIGVLPRRNNGVYSVGIGPLWGVKKVLNTHIGVIRADSLFIAPQCVDPWWGDTPTTSNDAFVATSWQDLGPATTSDKALQLIPMDYNPHDNICVDYTGGLNEEELAQIRIQPTISSGMFTIVPESGAPAVLEVLDDNGRVVYTCRVAAEQEIDLSSLHSGMYHYRYTAFDQTFSGTGKLIVLK